MFGLGAPELLIILIIMLLLFGANRLPKLMRSVGESARELRQGFNDPMASSSDATKGKAKDAKPKTAKKS